MRRLILMRHGEAVASELAPSDRLRELTTQGVAAAIRCGQEMRARGFSPELILCSDAKRAVMTMEAVVRGGSFTGIASKVLSLFYLAEPEAILGRCCEVDDAIETLLLIGHNPGWSDAATQLGKTPLNLGTAQAALLEYLGTGTWADALYDPKEWRLRSIVP